MSSKGLKYTDRNDSFNKLSEEQKEKHRKRIKKWRANNQEHCMWFRTKARAKLNNIPFNLEISDIIIPEYCPVLNIKITPIDASRKNGLCLTSPSIDKIRPELGYIKGNVIVVSLKANLIKSSATPDEILKVGEFYKNLSLGQRVLEPLGLRGRDTALALVA